MQIALQNKKRFAIVGILLLALTFILTGCQQIKPITDSSQVRNSFNTINTALVTAQGQVNSSSFINKETKQTKLKYTRTATNTLKAQVDSLDKVIASFSNTNHRFGLPKHTFAYAKSARNYINQAIQAKDPKELESSYHEVAKQGVLVFSKMPNSQKNKKSERLMASVMAFDLKQAQEDQKSKKNDSSSSTDNSSSLRPQDRNKQTSATQNLFTGKASKGIPFGLGVVLVILSVLIITFVFLQPSKANDAMSALSDTGGHDLLSEAKPDDYTLFLMRGTVFFAVVLVAILAYLEFKG